jgi:hypothetical protein
MSSTADGYRDGVALWAAATDRAKTEAAARGANSGALLRQFVNDRFLARVFHDPDAPWVLKGGTAVLARVNDARTTKDVDRLGELDNIDVALGRLRSAAGVDLGDHFRFIITGHERTVVGTGQPHVDGYRVHVDAYCGAVKRHTFGVDLVTGSLLTTVPDVQTPTPALNLRGLIPPTLRLYPVVDHIADKLCATQSTYSAAGDRPSSRVRDLVDLVVFARSQDVDGDALINAIRAKWTHQGLTGDPLFDPPVHWGRLYPPLARTVRKCEGLTTFPPAVEFVGRFLGPALDGSAAGRRWSSDLARWEPGPEVHATENP